jgi:DNA-binding NtrC family response regulator
VYDLMNYDSGDPRAPTGSQTRLYRILVVDDDQHVAASLQMGLNTLPNCEVVATTQAGDALQLFDRQPFDLLITDYMMPGMDGLTLAAHVQRSYPRTITIVITAYGESMVREGAASPAIRCILDKPVKLADIRQAASEALKEAEGLQGDKLTEWDPAASSPQVGEGDDAARVRRVLVMDDNADLRRLYGKVLGRAGYAVYPATTVEEARTLLGQGRFDVFLCDIHMGNERGTDLLREQIDSLREQGTQVIMVSGEAQYRPLCEEMGVDFYLEKPVALEPLVRLVDRLTAQR